MSETTVPSQAVRGADYLLEENHDLPLCRVQLTLRTGAETDVVGDGGPAEHPASGGRGIIGQCNFATELWRRGAGGGDVEERIVDRIARPERRFWHVQRQRRQIAARAADRIGPIGHGALHTRFRQGSKILDVRHIISNRFHRQLSLRTVRRAWNSSRRDAETQRSRARGEAALACIDAEPARCGFMHGCAEGAISLRLCVSA